MPRRRPNTHHSIFDDNSKTNYLETPRGKLGRYRWRNRKGRSYYLFNNTEPKSKKSMKTKGKIEFQKQILEQMKMRHKRSYRSKIAAHFSLSSTKENPPHIHTAMKNLLDLFEKPLDGSGIKRKGLVYQNDNQIKYLSADYSIGMLDNARIYADFEPFSNFLQNLELANDIISGKYNDYIDDYDISKKIKEIEGKKDEDEDDDYSEYKELIQNKKKYLKSLSEDAYKGLVTMSRMQVQKNFLQMGSLDISGLHYIFNSIGNIYSHANTPEIDKYTKETSDYMANLLLKSPIKIQLPRIPVNKGEGNQFKEEVREAMMEYREKYEILTPLMTPVGLEVIHKPPIASEGFHKDLDNIMREFIIPIFHEEFKPPISHLSNANLNSIKDEEMLNNIKKMKSKIPKSIEHSIVKYEIFEIPRAPDDKEDGFISMNISEAHRGIRSNIGNRIKEIIELLQGS